MKCCWWWSLQGKTNRLYCSQGSSWCANFVLFRVEETRCGEIGGSCHGERDFIISIYEKESDSSYCEKQQ